MSAKVVGLLLFFSTWQILFGDSSQTSAAAQTRVLITSRIPRQHIESTALRSVGYSKRRHVLEIEFVNGAIYRYYEVDPSVYRELLKAESKARYYDFNIRHKYLSTRVKPRVSDQH